MRLIVGILLPTTPVTVADTALLAQSAGQVAAHRVRSLIRIVLVTGIVVAALRWHIVAASQIIPASFANIRYLKANKKVLLELDLEIVIS